MTTIEYNHNLSKIESLLFGFAMKLTRNSDNARDLYQETLMRSYDKRDRFQAGTNFKSWVTTIMYNSFINQYRKNKTKNKVIKPIEDYMVEKPSGKSEVDSLFLLKDLKEMINSLSDNFRIPFQMHIDGYQYDEISEQLDLPIGTTKSRIFYARKQLQSMVTTRYKNIRSLRSA